MRDLIAKRPLTYATRRLLAGDAFRAKPRDARILIAINKAEAAPEPAPQAADLSGIRAEYEALFGKRPFMGWDEAILREKIAAHRADD